MDAEILWLECVDSTNSEAKRRIAQLNNMSVVATKCQTAGRGQNGHTWFSESSQSLTFSLVLKNLRLKSSEQAVISVSTAQVIVDTLALYGLSARIKWPNDIYCDDKKICGILIENSLLGEHIKWSIIGIGLNVNNLNFPTDLPNPTSMAICAGTEFQIEEVLDQIIDRLAHRLSRL